MKYITEFRNFEAAQALSREIHTVLAKDQPSGTEPAREIKIMEVCGGHTAAIHKYGIAGLLPSHLRLLSGPGCPVCVTSNSFLDYAVALAREPDVIIATFGDLIRVPGSRSSLLKERAEGRDIRICYSSLDALQIAKDNPSKRVVFLGVGFETTAPTIAASVKRAREEKVTNYLVLSAFKTMPNAMKALLESGELGLDAFICPGHVSVITGSSIYDFIARDYRTPCVISGFEPLDLLQSILMICRQITEGRAQVENQYQRAAQAKGNALAQDLLKEIFVLSDSDWRGIGTIPASGLALSPEYSAFDAAKQIPLKIEASRENPGCICGAIMRGVKTPAECKLFGKVCTPESPKGSCMVSDEGTCATFFKYARP